MYFVSIIQPQGSHYSAQIQTKKTYRIISFTYLLNPSDYSTFTPFSIFTLPFYFSLTGSVCVSRASIVQKRIIYFQDEGSLTIRLCEKGNDSCLFSSSTLLLVVFNLLWSSCCYYSRLRVKAFFFRLLVQMNSNCI